MEQYTHQEQYVDPSGMTISENQLSGALSDVMRRVYGLMTLGLILTGVTAWFTTQSSTLMTLLFENNIFFFGMIFGQLGLVVAISAGVRRFSPPVAVALFLLYSVLNGIVFATIFVIYTGASIATVFFITAGMFGGMSLIGFTTKTDMSKYRGFFLMGLIGFIIASIANAFFIQSGAFYWILTYAGVGLFLGLTIYDTQKIKNWTASAMVAGGDTSVMLNRIAVMGALTLYLDFVNLFILLLRIFGRRR